MGAFDFVKIFRVNKSISIDLGTANILIYDKQRKKIVLNEPSVVARDRKTGRLIAVGREAREMLGKTPDSIQAIKPLQDGVIADIDSTKEMITYFIHKIYGNSLFKPEVMICVPIEVTSVERKALFDAVKGAKKTYIIEEGRAAIIGSGVDISQPEGSMVIDIGGGSTDIAILSLDEIIASKSIRIAGNRFDEDIVKYVKRKYNLLIGERAGEDIKISVGSAIQLPEELTITVKGRDQVSGLLSRIELTSEDVREAMREPLKEIADALKTVLEMMPPDLAGDVVENGIVLTGGGALIRGLDKYLSDIVKLPVFVSDEPLMAVARGTGKALEEIALLQQLTNEE